MPFAYRLVDGRSLARDAGPLSQVDNAHNIPVSCTSQGGCRRDVRDLQRSACRVRGHHVCSQTKHLLFQDAFGALAVGAFAATGSAASCGRGRRARRPVATKGCRATRLAVPSPEVPPLDPVPELDGILKDSDMFQQDRVTWNRFCHGWSIAQLSAGYRYCFDDVICAHFAATWAPGARRLLDIGSGLGTIGLLWLGQQPRPFQPGACTLLEAQQVSVALCQETLRHNDLTSVVDLRHADLRDSATLAALGGGFDVVTLNPPYMIPGMGTLPQHSQRAHCRHELRGGLMEFCRAAADQLRPQGTLSIVHAAVRDSEVLEALVACDFAVRHRADIFARGGRKSVAFVCSLETPGSVASVADAVGSCSSETIEVQQLDGKWSEQWLALCSNLGL